MDGIGLDGIGSLGLVEYRAPYGANNVFPEKSFLDYTEISSVRCSMMKSIQAVSSLNPQSSPPRLVGHTQEMGNIFLWPAFSFQTKQV